MLKYVFLCLGFLLTGCGFQPLYVSHEDTLHQAASVQIEPIAGQGGYQAELILQKRLNPEGMQVPKKYRLYVTFHQPTYANQSIRSDNFASLEKMTIKASYTLKDIQKNQTVISATVDSNGLFNLVNDPYATVSAQDNLYDNLIKMMTDDIAMHVLSYFKGVSP